MASSNLKLSSKRQYNHVSEDPATASKAFAIRDQIARSEEHISVVKNARGELDTADSNIVTLNSILETVYEKATKAGGASSQDSMDAIAEELAVYKRQDQEYASTLFKGELFDLLRGILEKAPDLRMETAELLKAVNASISRQDVLDSVANSLEYLSEQLTGSRNLSGMFSQLAARVRESRGSLEFEELKPQDVYKRQTIYRYRHWEIFPLARGNRIC